MCDWGTTTKLWLKIPAHLSHTRRAYLKPVNVDACIAPLVVALNHAGITTIASCCGHAKRPGRITLADGRELFIVPDYETATKVDEAFTEMGFGPIHPQEICP